MKNYVYGLYKKDFVYTSSNIEEGLFYIGITTDIDRRRKSHRSQNYNPLKMNYIKKYDFNIVILYEENSKEDAEKRETFLIKWFGLIDEGGILTNLCKDIEDCMVRARKRVDREAINRGVKTRAKKYNKEVHRDARLSIPYKKVIELIEEWGKNPLIGQQEFAKMHNIKRENFKDWINTYKPEWKRLHSDTKNKVYYEMLEMIENGFELKDIIRIINEKYNIKYAKSIYNARRSQAIKRKEKVKYFKLPIDEEQKINYVNNWANTKLTLNSFARKNNLEPMTFKDWVTKYRPDCLSRIRKWGSAKTYRIIHPDGKIEIIKNLTQYCKINKLCVSSMVNLSNKKIKRYKGYSCDKLD